MSKNDTQKKHSGVSSILERGRVFLDALDLQKAIAFAKQAYEQYAPVCAWAEMIDSLYLHAVVHSLLLENGPSLLYYKLAEQLSIQIKDDIRLARIYRNMSDTYRELGQIQNAFESAAKALDIIQHYDNKYEIAASCLAMATIHLLLADYKKALDLSFQALELLRIEPNKKLEAQIEKIRGGIYEDTGKFDLALESYSRSLLIFREINMKQGEAEVLGNTGLVYGRMNQLESALEYFQIALSIYIVIGSEVNIVLSHGNISNAYTLLGNYEQALSHAKQALDAGKSIGSENARIVAIAQYGTVLNAMGGYKDALANLLDAHSLIMSGEDNTHICDVLEQIALSYESLGDTVKALEYQKLLLQARENRIKEIIRSDIHTLETRYVIEKAQSEKKVYQLKAIQLETELKIKSKEIMQLGLSAIQKNEFLLLLRREVAGLLPSFTGKKKEIGTLLKEIEAKIDFENAHTHFDTALEQFHGEFYNFLKNRYPALTKTERKICSCIQLDLTSKEISDLLFTSIRTVEGHRLKIRKKMMIENHRDIADVLNSLFLSLPQRPSKGDILENA